MDRKRLQDCRTEADLQQNYPQLCNIADAVDRASNGNPGRLIGAIAYILKMRQEEAAADGGKKE